MRAVCPEPPLDPPVYCYRCPLCGATPFAAVYLTRGGEIRGCDQCLLSLPPEEGGIAWPDPWVEAVRALEHQGDQGGLPHRQPEPGNPEP